MSLTVEMNEGIPEVQPKDVLENKTDLKLIDVRNPDEFTGPLGHVEGAELATLGDEYDDYLDTLDKSLSIVVICRSGGRSGRATMIARERGFEKIYNMAGGMLAWNDQGLPTVSCSDS